MALFKILLEDGRENPFTPLIKYDDTSIRSNKEMKCKKYIVINPKSAKFINILAAKVELSCD